jgi:hypothetical protein
MCLKVMDLRDMRAWLQAEKWLDWTKSEQVCIAMARNMD